MLKTISKPVMIALTLMLMSLSPMVGNASATGTEYFELVEASTGNYVMDGDTLSLQSGTPLEITQDMFDLEIGDYYDNYFDIEDGSGISVVDEYESFAANYSQETRFFNNTLLDDCGYEAQVELLHYNDTTGAFDTVDYILFYVEVGDCNSILADFEDATIDEEMLIMLVPDHEPGEEEQPDIYAMGDMKIDSNFRGLLDSDGDGDVTESELYFYSGLYDALHDEHYPDEGIPWTLDGVTGISEEDDVQLFFDLEELLGPITNATYTADNAWVQSYLMFNVTGLGGLEDDSTQTLEFDDFSADGMTFVMERGMNLMVTNVTLNGTGAYYMEEYSTSADATFECSSEVGGEPDMEIDFYKVNDGTEDCGDGSDEPQDMDPLVDSDGDGVYDNDHDSWFDCNDEDGTTVNMDVVNDGAWDCNDGEDEGMEYVPASWELPQGEGTLILELGAIQMQDLDIFMQSVTSEEIRFSPVDELLVDVVFAFDGDVREYFDDDDDGLVSSPELNELWSQLEEAMNDGDDETDDGKANFTLDGVFHSVDIYFNPDLYQLLGPTDAGDGEVVMTFTVITLDTSDDHFIAIDDMEFDGMLCIENTEYFTVGSATWDGVEMEYDADLDSTCAYEETEGTLEFELVATNNDNGMDDVIDKVDLGFELFNSADGGITVEFEVTIVAIDGEEGHASALRMEADNHGDGDGIVNQLEADMFTQEFDILDDEKTYWCHEDDDGDETTEEGYEIPFEQVNDGAEDCTNGEDEPQDMDPAVDSDGDGDYENDHDSWYDCNDGDGTTVNMDVVNDGTEDCPNGEDENWDEDFFFFDGVAFNDGYTNIVFSSTGLVGDVDQAGDVEISVLYTYEFSDASQDVGHLLELDICCDGGDNDEDEPPTPEEAMNETDANGDGYMSYEEFEAAWNSTDENSTEEDTDAELDWDAVADLFANCDNDANDLIDIDEMECFIDGITDMMSGDDGPPTPEEAMEETDANGDGYMSYEEFEAAWNSTDDNSTEEDTDAELDWDAVADLFDNCDSDADDLIDIDEMECIVDGITDMMMGESGDGEWYLELFSNMDWNLVNVTHNGNVVDAMIDNGHYGASIMNIDVFTLSAYFEPCIDIDADGDCDEDTTVGPDDCAADEIWDEDTQTCVEDTTVGPDDCAADEIWDEDTQTCVADPALSCADGEIWDYVVEACVDDGIITEGDCADNETFQQDAAGVGECVETIIEPQDCPDGEILDPLTNTCVEDTTVVDEPDTAPTCNVFYWVGTTGNPTNNWNWTEMMSGWSEFNAPDNGEYTLALPKGDYFVYFGCWDAEGDTITLAVDGLPEIQEFEAEESWVWGWDEFSINDQDVGVQHDMVITWSSTDFGGTVTIHFKGVTSVADAVAESDTGGLPGFTASLGLMAMLGAALILARRKD